MEGSSRPNIQQGAEESAIGQIELRALHDGLGAVREPWLQQHDLPGSLQCGQPMVSRGRSDTDVPGQISLVQ
jgi:hypothetical protein